jgi:predicted nucleotidyltransferase
MPVRSLSSSVLKWPDAPTVDAAVRRWAETTAATHPAMGRVGYFGSYARGDWGVGSDVDVVVIVRQAGEAFERRGLQWDTTRLPVPADVLVYTEAEWDRFRQADPFGRRIAREVIWVR